MGVGFCGKPCNKQMEGLMLGFKMTYMEEIHVNKAYYNRSSGNF